MPVTVHIDVARFTDRLENPLLLDLEHQSIVQAEVVVVVLAVRAYGFLQVLLTLGDFIEHTIVLSRRPTARVHHRVVRLIQGNAAQSTGPIELKVFRSYVAPLGGLVETSSRHDSLPTADKRTQTE